MLAQDLRQMLAEALRIGHARCIVLFTIERHTDTLSSGWFHGSDSLYGAVCSMHSIGLEVESSYCLHRFSTNHEIRWNQENPLQHDRHEKTGATKFDGVQEGDQASHGEGDVGIEADVDKRLGGFELRNDNGSQRCPGCDTQ